MKTIIITILSILLANNTKAQIQSVELQAAGLTCSMCSKAIYKSLQSLPAVKEVNSNIKTSTYTIFFKEGAVISFDELKNAVTDAGFSIAVLNVVVQFSNQTIQDEDHLELEGKKWHFMNVGNQVLNGSVKLRVIDKNFVTAKEFKQFNKYTKKKCYQTGFMESCCSKEASTSNRIYHVTISSMN
jgi:copper chaperone CopZ